MELFFFHLSQKNRHNVSALIRRFTSMPVSATFYAFLLIFSATIYRVLFFEYQIPKTFSQSAGEMRGYCASRDNAVDYISFPDKIRRCRGKIANSDRIFIHSFGARGKCRPHFIRLWGTCF